MESTSTTFIVSSGEASVPNTEASIAQLRGELLGSLTELDRTRLVNYIDLWGQCPAHEFIGVDQYFRDWATAKQGLYKAFGNKLMVKKPVAVEQNQFEKDKSVSRFMYEGNAYSLLRQSIKGLIQDNVAVVYDEEYPEGIRDSCQIFYRVIDKALFYAQSIKENRCIKTFSIEFEEGKKVKIQEGTRLVRAFTKINNAFGKKYGTSDVQFKAAQEAIEEFGQKHSLLFNTNALKGNLVLSIHPLDFMTMSDNDYDWESCMSWRHDGCYHLGTLEFMNSPYVVCAYLEGEKPFFFGSGSDRNIYTRRARSLHIDAGDETYHWSNKKWRQNFVLTKERIIGDRPYPYKSDKLEDEAFKFLKELLLENCNLHFEDEKVEFKSAYIDSEAEFQIHCDVSNPNKDNGAILTELMYNNFLNWDNAFYCVETTDKYTIMDYSYNIAGVVRCLRCGKVEFIPLEDNYNNDCDYDDDEYSEPFDVNNRYSNNSETMCYSCRSLDLFPTCINCWEILAGDNINVTISRCHNEDDLEKEICLDCFFRNYVYHKDDENKIPISLQTLIRNRMMVRQGELGASLSDKIEYDNDFYQEMIELTRHSLVENAILTQDFSRLENKDNPIIPVIFNHEVDCPPLEINGNIPWRHTTLNRATNQSYSSEEIKETFTPYLFSNLRTYTREEIEQNDFIQLN